MPSCTASIVWIFSIEFLFILLAIVIEFFFFFFFVFALFFFSFSNTCFHFIPYLFGESSHERKIHSNGKQIKYIYLKDKFLVVVRTKLNFQSMLFLFFEIIEWTRTFLIDDLDSRTCLGIHLYVVEQRRRKEKKRNKQSNRLSRERERKRKEKSGLVNEHIHVRNSRAKLPSIRRIYSSHQTRRDNLIESIALMKRKREREIREK